MLDPKKILIGLFFATADFVSALFLSIYAMIIGPLGILKIPFLLEKFIFYLSVFLPTRNLSRAIRVAIDWRTGHFATAIAQAETLINGVERYLKARPRSRVRRQVLLDLYTLLARAYMHTGHIDEAMQVILRANRTLKIDKLSGLPELDAKTAHLVRAGLAAGKLLEGGGLATMFVKSAPTKPSSQKKPITPASSSPKQDDGAKVIPFPQH